MHKRGNKLLLIFKFLLIKILLLNFLTIQCGSCKFSFNLTWTEIYNLVMSEVHASLAISFDSQKITL